MYLSDITLSGFKSFARTTHFQFRPGVTAILGPNGSGKSNVAEAVRWVLGEQSLKQLRAAETADVIFAGSAHRRPESLARVSLTINNESGRLNFPAAEVTITRTINRHGEGSYALNGEAVRLLDIQQLLAEAGIGTKSYTVVSQGMVSRYLDCTPAERKELFDEATGIRALQLKLTRAQRDLEKTEHYAMEVELVLRELEPRLRVLKRQIQRQAERETLEAEYSAKQHAYFLYTWHQQRQKVAHLTTEVAATEQRLTGARQRRTESEQAVLSTATAAASTIISLQEELWHAEQAYRQARERAAATQAERARLEASLTRLERDLAQAEERLQSAQASSVALNWFTPLRGLLEQCQYLCLDIHDGKTIKAADVQRLSAEIATWHTKLSDTEELAGVAEELVKAIVQPLQTMTRLSALVESERQRLASVPHIAEPSDETVRQLRHAVTQATHQETSQLEAELAAARQQELEAERSITHLKTLLTQAETELTELEGTIRREEGTEFLTTIQNTTAPVEVPCTTEELRALAEQVARLGEIDPLAAKEYEEVAARYHHLEQQLADIERSKTSSLTLMSQLAQEMQQRFMTQLAAIRETFTDFFAYLFGGGAVAIEVTEEGVDIKAQPPGKRPHRLQVLSGGEKALTSLALLMAILHVQRPPFVVVDEVDAALDEANSARFSELLRQHSHQTQWIVISHNRETVAAADVLYGVIMGEDGVSKTYSVKLEDV
jgi:chromosome segregation protein